MRRLAFSAALAATLVLTGCTAGAQPAGSSASGDIADALQKVQAQRAALLDKQLADQIKAVQDQNDFIAELNSALADLTTVRSATKSDARADTVVDTSMLSGASVTRLASVGVAISPPTTLSTVDAAITKVKVSIDSAATSQQMAMLRLQSLTNKRDEAFELAGVTPKSGSDNGVPIEKLD